MNFAFPLKSLHLLGTVSNDNWGLRSVVLAIEFESMFRAQGQTSQRQVTHVRFAGLSRTAFDHVAPTTVAIPLIAKPYDALDMIAFLQDIGYAQRIVVIAPALPNRAMVERELRAAGPQGRLTLISV